MKIHHQGVRLLLLTLLFWLQTLVPAGYAVTNTAGPQTAIAENDQQLEQLVELPVTRFQTDEPIDAYNSVGLAGVLKKQYHRQSELQMRIKTEQQRYPDSEVLDLSGAAVAGTQLQLDINRIGL